MGTDIASRSSRVSPALTRSLEATCLLFASMGLLLAVAGSSAIFGPWRTAAAEALLAQPELPTTLEPFVALTNGILGGSIVGKWLAALWLTHYPLAEGRRWAWRRCPRKPYAAL